MILLVLVSYFTYERITDVDRSLAQRGVLVARQLGPAAEFALFAGDRAALQRLTDAAIREADVANVVIADSQGQALAHSASSGTQSPDDTVSFTEPVQQTRVLPSDFPESSHASQPTATVGHITVTMSKAGARERQQRLLLVGFALGLTCLLVAIILALVIGNGVVQPIRRMAAAMVTLGQGQRFVPISFSGGGEFRTLSDGFNRMAERVRAGTRELEQQVREATRALTAQKDTAEQATTAKSRFIAAASHDLRQPLHAIGLFSAALQRRAQGTDLESVAGDLAKAVSVMDRLFDSLLDISRLDSGTMRADPRAFLLQRLFIQIGAEYSEAAAQKGLQLHLKATEAVVVTDELLLHRILSNLVANAIRYTQQGTVMICARRRGGDVQIEVRDSGVGIAPDKHTEIFQEFYQIGNPARDRTTGLGLGLAIVARLARLLETEVTVRSAPGDGSVFALRVPRGEKTALAYIPLSEPAAIEERSTVRVLVIDDDPLVLAGNRALLEELGCQVTTVGDAQSAERALAASADRPTLVLCDLWLSDTDNGIDLLRRLHPLTPGPVYCILISGDTRPETINAAKLAGLPLLHKPVSPAKLRAVVMEFSRKMRTSNRPSHSDEDSAG